MDRPPFFGYSPLKGRLNQMSRHTEPTMAEQQYRGRRAVHTAQYSRG